jgi:hypothetical protein
MNRNPVAKFDWYLTALIAISDRYPVDGDGAGDRAYVGDDAQ